MNPKNVIESPTLFIIGLLITLLGAWLVCLLMGVIKKYEDYSPPKGIAKERWEKAFKLSANARTPIIILGFIEASFYYISFVLERPELIAGWLTFKLASKWQTWSAISKIPEQIKHVDPIEYIGAKNRVASHTLQRWLIGTLGNILAGFAGIGGISIIPNISICSLMILAAYL